MRKYGHHERLDIQEVSRDEMQREHVDAALDNLAFVVDSSLTISLASDPGATSEHPAWRAIVAMGELSLPFLLTRLRKAEGWWEIMAADRILSDLYIQVSIPQSHRGKIGLLRKDFVGILRKALRKDGRLKESAQGDPPTPCACGRPGKWIADGICRTGYYCRACSKKALDNA